MVNCILNIESHVNIFWLSAVFLKKADKESLDPTALVQLKP